MVGALTVSIPFQVKFGDASYEAYSTSNHILSYAEYLFSIIKLAEKPQNLGHASAGSTYSGLKRA